MSLTSYQAAPPCNKGRCISVHGFATVNGFLFTRLVDFEGPLGRAWRSEVGVPLYAPRQRPGGALLRFQVGPLLPGGRRGRIALARRGSAASFAQPQVPNPVFSAANFRRVCRHAAVWLGAGCALLARGERESPPWRAKDVVQYSFENHGLELGLPGTVVTTAIQTR